jgi:hypothetical protein
MKSSCSFFFNHHGILEFNCKLFWTLHYIALHRALHYSKSKPKLCYGRLSVGQLSWCQASISDLRPDFYYCHTVAYLLMWGALADERTCLPFTIDAGPRQRSHSWVRVLWDSWPYFTVSVSRIPQPGGPGPRIYIPQEEGGPVIPPGTGSHFVAFYDLQGYDGGVRTRLYVGYSLTTLSDNRSSLYRLRTDNIENTNHVIPSQRFHWRADCCLATSYSIRPLRHIFHFYRLGRVYRA